MAVSICKYLGILFSFITITNSWAGITCNDFKREKRRKVCLGVKLALENFDCSNVAKKRYIYKSCQCILLGLQGKYGDFCHEPYYSDSHIAGSGIRNVLTHNLSKVPEVPKNLSFLANYSQPNKNSGTTYAVNYAIDHVIREKTLSSKLIQYFLSLMISMKRDERKENDYSASFDRLLNEVRSRLNQKEISIEEAKIIIGKFRERVEREKCFTQNYFSDAHLSAHPFVLDELAIKIFSYLNPIDLARISNVSKRAYNLARDEVSWKKRLLELGYDIKEDSEKGRSLAKVGQEMMSAYFELRKRLPILMSGFKNNPFADESDDGMKRIELEDLIQQTRDLIWSDN